MADEPVEGQQAAPADNAAPAAATVSRPDYIPETIWDGEKNAPKIDLAATLTEYDTFKTQAAERAALIPAKPEEYKFDLPKGFELPAGKQWLADPNDPMVASFRTLASELKLTQPEVERLVAFEAGRQANELKAQAAFDDAQTKALGSNAEARRADLSGRLDAIFQKDSKESAIFKTLLVYEDGVVGLEKLFAGVATRGNAGDRTNENKNAENVALVGTPGGGRRLLQAANAPKN